MELLRATPDLSLRALFVIISICLIISAYVIGMLHGRSSLAESQLKVSGALAFEPYDPSLLTPKSNTPAGIGVSSGAKNFVASANGKSYYPVNCKAASRIKEENRVWFASVAEAESQGLTPSTQCSH
jgi:hypothetical protein